ncbi:MAG TPA: hypothetical protein VMB21_01545 [Candidatus Limnocylindria bacterium]|nr:hypothetical protein [Candidatus Limnocylindria bacterium]
MSDPICEDVGMKNELPFTPPAPAPARREIRPAQLDFTLPASPTATTPTSRRTSRRQRPCSNERAAWWFDQMRRVVDEGRDVEVTGVW